MKTNTETKLIPSSKHSFSDACLASCRKMVAQMKQAKNAILREFNGTFEAQEHLLRLAVNEAEALAWQTGFPQLVFPDLAMEKAQAVAAWQMKQRKLI